MTTTYVYGGFTLHDGANYFLREKSFDLPDFHQTTFVPGRREGLIKSGERLDSVTRAVTITVIGSSRIDLEQKLDALFAALALRQQSLVIHAEDTRYYVADAVAARAHLVYGRVVSCDVNVSFVYQRPFAYSPDTAGANGYTSGTLALSSAGSGAWKTASALLVPALAGNLRALPTLVLRNETAANATTLTSSLTSGSVYTSLNVAALPTSASVGQVFLITSGTNVQRVALNAPALAGATTLSVASFTANATYLAGAFCGLDVYLLDCTLTQTTDSESLTISSLSAQLVGYQDALLITSDPSSINGFTVIPSRTRTPLTSNVSGAFPTLDVGGTNFSVQVTCNNQPSIAVQITWTPRWLA